MASARKKPRALPRASTNSDEAARLRGAGAILRTYRKLAATGTHIMAPVLKGAAPVQWEHYPFENAFSSNGRYQWYYHSHSPADRPAAEEHGHFHLFARMEGIQRRLDSARERRFLATLAVEDSPAPTRHMLGVGLNGLGVPISLFTVNRWVTGDLMLSGAATVALLESMTLKTGYPEIDALLVGLVRLYRADIRALIRRRDAALRSRARKGGSTLDDERLEVLSEIRLDIDRSIAWAMARAIAPRSVAEPRAEGASRSRAR
jgi:hypothetical protein